MNARILSRLGVVAGALVFAGTGSFAPATAEPNDAAAARQATSAYHNSSFITEDDENWFQLYDRDGITCIDSPAGGMGIHFVNGARVNDARVIASQPEAVIYEPAKNGKLRLVAVEYVVTKAAWEGAGNIGRPSLFGTKFEFVPEGNRYGLPDFYELHAWVWRHNPNGMNEDWNPKVSCDEA